MMGSHKVYQISRCSVASIVGLVIIDNNMVLGFEHGLTVGVERQANIVFFAVTENRAFGLSDFLGWNNLRS